MNSREGLRSVDVDISHKENTKEEDDFFRFLNREHLHGRVPFSGNKLRAFVEQYRESDAALTFLFGAEVKSKMAKAKYTQDRNSLLSSELNNKEWRHEYVKRLVQYLIRYVRVILELLNEVERERHPKLSFAQNLKCIEDLQKIKTDLISLLDKTVLLFNNSAGQEIIHSTFLIDKQNLDDVVARIAGISDGTKVVKRYIDLATTLFSGYWKLHYDQNNDDLITGGVKLFDVLYTYGTNNKHAALQLIHTIDTRKTSIPQSIHRDIM